MRVSYNFQIYLGWTFQANPKDVFSEFFGNLSPFAELTNGDTMFAEIREAEQKKMPTIEVITCHLRPAAPLPATSLCGQESEDMTYKFCVD